MKSKDRPFCICFLKRPDKEDYIVAGVSLFVLPLICTLFDLLVNQKCTGMCNFWSMFCMKFCKQFLQGFVYGLLLTVIVYTIRVRCRLRKNKELKNKLKDSMNKILVSVDTKDENGTKKDMFYLTEIINSQINIGEFKPDNLLIDQVDKCKAILSVTESPIALWLDPTYLFFLTCQVVNSIAKHVPKTSVSYCRPVKKRYETRKRIIPFFQQSHSLLKDFKALDSKTSIDQLSSMLTKSDIRIYFMNGDDISKNKGLVEWFVATHDLAGIHLLIIDRNILQTESLKHPYNEMRNVMMAANNERLDCAFRFYDNSELWYAVRNFTQLHDVQIVSPEDPSMKALSVFLKELSLALENNKERLFYPNEFGRFNISKENGDEYRFQGIVLNEEKAQIIINK